MCEREFGVPQNSCQNVVEVVGYAAGQPANAVNLLRLAVLAFQFQFMSDVALDGDVMGDGVFFVANGGDNRVFRKKSAALFFVDEAAAPDFTGADFGP